MLPKLQSLLILFLLVISTFASHVPLHLQSIKYLKQVLEQNFSQVLQKAIAENEDLVVLLNINHEIEHLFLTSGPGKIITSDVYERINQYFINVLKQNDLLNNLAATKLWSYLSTNLQESIQWNKLVSKRIDDNKVLLGVMADICHLFKGPVQWLILASKAYGYSEVFNKVPKLLENLRKAFLNGIDPYDTVIFDVELSFIKNSFSFYFDSIDQKVKNSPIYKLLTTQFFTQIDKIIADLKSSPRPFRKYFTNKRNKEIIISDKLMPIETRNEDLWAYIIDQIEKLRPLIDNNNQNLKLISDSNVIDIMKQNLLILSQNSVLFTLKTAHKSIKSSFQDYYSLISQRLYLDSAAVHDFEKMQIIFERSLKEFNDHINTFNDEISSALNLDESIDVSMDWTPISIGKLASGQI